MAKMNGAEIILDYLIKEKVPYLFGVVGHGIFGLLDPLATRLDKLKYVVVHHEQAAGHMADAYYRVSHQPVATFTSCGPGSANIPISLANAYMDDSAFLAITGNVATSQFNRGTFQEVYKHYQADFPSTIQPYVKRSFQATRVEQLPLMLRQSFALMKTGRPGPVNLDVPYNLFGEVADVEVPDPDAWNNGIDVQAGASPEAAQKALDALMSAQRPVILVGNGAALSEAEADVLALAESLNIPVAFSPMGVGTVSADHALALGTVGRNGNFPAIEAVRNADVLLALGADFDDRASSAWIAGFTFNIPPTKLIQVDTDAQNLARNFPVYLGINASPRTVARQVRSLAKGDHRHDHGEWLRQIGEWKAEWTEYNEDRYRPEAKPIQPEHILRMTRKALPKDGILAVDVGSHHTWVTQRWDAYLPRTVVQSYGYGAIGAGTAGALGAKLAAPDRPVVAIVGDSGFLMVSHVVATAVEYDIPVTWIVWNNCGYGVHSPAHDYLSRFRNQRTGQDLSPDYATLARGYGAEGIKIEAPDQLGDAVWSAVRSNRPTVIDVVVDPTATPVMVGGWQLPPAPPTLPNYPRRHH